MPHTRPQGEASSAPRPPHLVYLVTQPIPLLGAESGDELVISPTQQVYPLILVQEREGPDRSQGPLRPRALPVIAPSVGDAGDPGRLGERRDGPCPLGRDRIAPAPVLEGMAAESPAHDLCKLRVI